MYAAKTMASRNTTGDESASGGETNLYRRTNPLFKYIIDPKIRAFLR